jgi:hypothetical protein
MSTGSLPGVIGILTIALEDEETTARRPVVLRRPAVPGLRLAPDLFEAGGIS